MANTIVCGVTIDPTNTSVMEENLEVSNVAMANEIQHHVQDPAFKQSRTSNKATSRDKGEHNVVIVYSTSPDPAPLNYAQLATVTCDQVEDMIGQDMETFAEHQRQENEQFWLSIQPSLPSSPPPSQPPPPPPAQD